MKRVLTVDEVLNAASLRRWNTDSQIQVLIEFIEARSKKYGAHIVTEFKEFLEAKIVEENSDKKGK